MRATTSGWAAANAGVNQRATTESATAAVPSRRTSAARSVHDSGGPMTADVEHRTSRSTRSGACTATHIETIPPRETPNSEARAMPVRSSRASRSEPRSAIEYGASGTGDRPCPRRS
jgi:hypothetical protein